MWNDSLVQEFAATKKIKRKLKVQYDGTPGKKSETNVPT
jgi:hypothetical protein